MPISQPLTADDGPSPELPGWQQSLKQAVREPVELIELLGLDSQWAQRAEQANRLFPLFATREYLARVEPGNPHDPLLRQLLPLDAELISGPGYSDDPVGDLASSPRPGLLQKYQSRALLVATGACAIHCRYCFRRHYPYQSAPPSPITWGPALRYLREHQDLDEVILSGGDPLTLSDSTLSSLVHQLAEIPHLRRLRIHTRLPIMIPQRVTPELLDWLTGTRLTPWFVLHTNHPQELDQSVWRSVERLLERGIPVLNQAVLLRGVNDDLVTLEQLCRQLIDHRVVPYYLHQLDRVRGAAHFEVPTTRGFELVEQLRQRLPGYAVPRYVVELPGEPYKVPL